VNDSTSTVDDLKSLMAGFIAERQWEPFHDPKNLSTSIAIEAAELMEHFQWLRSDQLESVQGDERTMREVREEVADILAYLLSFATRMNIDLSAALEDKMRKNAAKYPAEDYRGRFRK
jgi:dCTP diphosphatase